MERVTLAGADLAAKLWGPRPSPDPLVICRSPKPSNPSTHQNRPGRLGALGQSFRQFGRFLGSLEREIARKLGDLTFEQAGRQLAGRQADTTQTPRSPPTALAEPMAREEGLAVPLSAKV